MSKVSAEVVSSGLLYDHISICGLGYVGGSVAYVCKQNGVKFSVFDIAVKHEPQAIGVYNEIEALVSKSEQQNENNFYFICVPTPSKKSGECDTTIVESVVENIHRHAQKKSYVLIKSTVQPGTCRKLFNKFSSTQFQIVFIPEFLTEKRANLDAFDANFALVGSEDGSEVCDVVEMIKGLYQHNPQLEIVNKKFEVCELFKYTINTFLSIKVWFFNEVYELSEKLGFDYNELKEILRLDSRIGTSHINIPGYHGFKFGGSCFLKDSNGFRFLQNSLGIPDTVLNEILNRNDELGKKPF